MRNASRALGLIWIECFTASLRKEGYAGKKRYWLDPLFKKIPWGRESQPTPVFLPGESYGQRSLAGYSPWGHKEWDMTE